MKLTPSLFLRTKALWILACTLGLLAACSSGQTSPVPSSSTEPVALTQAAPRTATPAASPTAAPTPTPDLGPEPSERVAAFYYPWYGNPDTNGAWVHWEGERLKPPGGILSDYFPTLDLYSSAQEADLARHFDWLRRAGIGVIISSWWGLGSYEDQRIPALLDQAAAYRIKVAFHIEPYGDRNGENLVRDVVYLYEQYGDHPAFYRTTAQSRWSPDDRQKGLFFLWAAGFAGGEQLEAAQGVEGPEYWQSAVDAIHGLPDGGLVIANSTEGSWIDGGHFDGLYNYATLDLENGPGFTWAQGLPEGAWYIPSVLPGFSALNLDQDRGDPAGTSPSVPRRDGATYQDQWRAALGAGVEPALVAVTSFNEWHEGTQIEPAAEEKIDSQGQAYLDYRPLPPEGYLDITREWAGRLDALAWPEGQRALVRIITSSDWTTFGLAGGGFWVRPELVHASPEADYAGLVGNRLSLRQALKRAHSHESVEMTFELSFAGYEPQNTLEFTIERGHVGDTRVELLMFQGDELVVVETFFWDGINPDPNNTLIVEMPASALGE